MTQHSTQPPATGRMTMVLRECGICQTAIMPEEQTTVCPKCALVFHAECWEENMGCAAYGCEQVNALVPKPPEQPVEELPPPVDRPVERLPWNFVLLGAAAICLLVSALTFGVPSLLVLGCAVWRAARLKLLGPALLRNPGSLTREPILVAAGVLAAAGVVLGATVSTFWWLSGDTAAPAAPAAAAAADAASVIQAVILSLRRI